MTAVDLPLEVKSRFLKDVGDENRAFFTQDVQIAEAFAVTGGSYHAAVLRGLYWMYQKACNVPSDMSGIDPKERQALIDRRLGAIKVWEKQPAPADAPTEGVGRKGTFTPPVIFTTAKSAWSRRRGYR